LIWSFSCSFARGNLPSLKLSGVPGFRYHFAREKIQTQEIIVSATTISAYLIHRLQDLGVGHVFGVPGDYVLGFCKALEDSPLGGTRLMLRLPAPQ